MGETIKGEGDLRNCLAQAVVQRKWNVVWNEYDNNLGGHDGHFVGFKHADYEECTPCKSLADDMDAQMTKMQLYHPDWNLPVKTVRLNPRGPLSARMEMFIMPRPSKSVLEKLCALWK